MLIERKIVVIRNEFGSDRNSLEFLQKSSTLTLDPLIVFFGVVIDTAKKSAANTARNEVVIGSGLKVQ